MSRSSASTASAAHTPEWTRSTPSARSSLATEAASGLGPVDDDEPPGVARAVDGAGRTRAMDGHRRAALEPRVPTPEQVLVAEEVEQLRRSAG